MLLKITLLVQRMFIIRAKVRTSLEKYYSTIFLDLQFKMKTTLEKNFKKNVIISEFFKAKYLNPIFCLF